MGVLAVTPPVVLAALLALAPYSADRDESPEARAALLEPVADAIAAVARTPEDAAALIALGSHETHFARYVLEGRCAEGPSHSRCDAGRARGPWQLWAVACPRAWALPVGSPESLRAEAGCALGNLRAARMRCENRAASLWEGAFSGYAGASCAIRSAPARVQTMRRVLARLEGRR